MRMMRKPWRKPQPHERLPDPEGKVAQSDPNGVAITDDQAKVFEASAFVGLRASSHFATARQILGNPARDVQPTTEKDDALLPVMHCGAAGPDGQRCGAAIRPVRLGRELGYHSSTCVTEKAGHLSKFSRVLEDIVLAMVEEALPTEELLHAISGLSFRVEALRQRVSQLSRQLLRVTDDLAEVSKAELEARREGRDDDRKHWAQFRASLRKREDALLAESRVAGERAAALGESGASARLAEEIRSLACDVPTLLRKARAVPGLTRALIGALTTAISVAPISARLVLVEIEFLDGSVRRRLALTGSFRCTQPQRAAAWALRRAGRASVEIAAQLTPHTDVVSAYRVWSAKEVDTLALLHERFEKVSPRDALHLTSEKLARQLEFSSAEFLDVLLTGAIGPLRIGDDGRWLVAPTETEKETVSEAYARRQTARRTGWRVSNIVSAKVLAESVGARIDSVTNAVKKRPDAKVFDLSGRLFVNTAMLSSYWRRPASRTRACQDDTRERHLSAVRAAVVAAGFAEHEVEDFVQAKELVARLRTNTGRVSIASLTNALKHGSIVGIRYRGPASKRGAHPPKLLVRCPREVRESRDPAVVLNWLGGGQRRQAALARAAEARRDRRGERSAT